MSSRLDLPRIGVASVVTAALGISLAAAFLQHAQSTRADDVGPTAATLDDAFSLFVGAALGVALGGVLGALLVRRGSRFVSGLLVGLLVYIIVLAPVFVATDDISLAEDLDAGGLAFLALLALPLGVSAALGAIVGDFLVRLRRSGRRARA